MDIIKWSEPREAVEVMGTFGVEERGAPLELDGASADILCDGIAEILAENIKLHKYLAFTVGESQYDEDSWNDAAWSYDDITVKELYALLNGE